MTQVKIAPPVAARSGADVRQPHSIALSGVRFSYNGRVHTIFEDFSLDIPAVTITALLGPNGSGKTTLLQLILGMLTPQAGDIYVGSRARSAYSRQEFGRMVGLVAQEEQVPFDFTVLDYVLLGRAPRLRLLETPTPADVRVARHALVMVGLLSLQHRSIQALSGGERQLATVARALAQEPQILLLDEPTSHLDLSNRRRLLDVMRRLRFDGKTVLFTTHDPNEVAAVADHVVLLRDGHIEATGPIHETLTQEHLEATYDINVEVVELNGRPQVIS